MLEKSDWITGLIGVAVIGAFVGGGMMANRRPFGLLWDLMCFLPRTAHPFAPPCYAERAVPELTDCTRKWLRADTDREVVLSAHSLGGVLAVATIFALPGEDVERVKLLTYGVQLRTYFGRIFPELLGPLVLGTPGADAASPLARDPWVRREGNNPSPPADSAADYSLKKLLDGRWYNLWRRTDYLGFPVYGWQDNPIDRRAVETNGSGKVQTHSDYPLCASYKEQFETLVPPSPIGSPRTTALGTAASGKATSPPSTQPPHPTIQSSPHHRDPVSANPVHRPAPTRRP